MELYDIDLYRDDYKYATTVQVKLDPLRFTLKQPYEHPRECCDPLHE